MKRTTDYQWAHINCALWIPEGVGDGRNSFSVFFQDPDGRDYIDYFHIPEWRWHRKCCFCNSSEGCCMLCSGTKCDCTFHVSCGIEHNVAVSASFHLVDFA